MGKRKQINKDGDVDMEGANPRVEGEESDEVRCLIGACATANPVLGHGNGKCGL